MNGIEQYFPCTSGQAGIYFAEKLGAPTGLYSVLYTLEFKVELSQKALEYALNVLICRHPALRSSFAEHEGVVIQKISPSIFADVVWHDLRNYMGETEEAEAEKLTHAFAVDPFDLARGPLMKVSALRLSGAKSRLLLGFHHIVFDGWSAQIFAGELSFFYSEYKDGTGAEQNGRAMNYQEIVLSELRNSQAPSCTESLEYWGELLTNAPSLSTIPSDRARAVKRTYSGETFRIDIPQHVVSRLLFLIEELSVTPFILFSAIVAILLHKMSGEMDILLGYPSAGRQSPESEKAIGLFTNMLVLRSKLKVDTTLRMAVWQLAEQLCDSLEHTGCSFDRIVETVGPVRSSSRHPLFQVCVTHELEDDIWQLEGEAAASRNIITCTSKFDLLLALEQSDTAGWSLKVEYSKELFDRDNIDRVIRRLFTLIAEAPDNLDIPLQKVRIIDDCEYAWLLEAGNGRVSKLPSSTITSIFEEKAADRPTNIAALENDRKITYRELNEKANSVAHQLKKIGVSTETRVGLLTGRGINLLIGMLAILKAGGAYVPLEANFESSRLTHLLVDSNITVILSEKSFRPFFPQSFKSSRILFLDDDFQLDIDRTNDSPNPPRVDHGKQLAYVMYTSGSTGKPKGVAIDHRAIIRLLIANPFLPFEGGLILPQLASASFDPSTLEIWGALLHGGTVAFVEHHLVLNPVAFNAFISVHDVKVINFASTLLSRLAHEMPRMFAECTDIIFGGDRADASALKSLRANGVEANLINGYGPTEATTLSCVHTIRNADLENGDIPIGRPFANTSAYILDEHLEIVPIGVLGELYLGGDGVARGYDRQPALTAERFVPDPFAIMPGARLYSTGDICLWDRAGFIRYRGRRDSQIKIDGFRVEIGEVTHHILNHPRIKASVIDVEDDGSGQKRLVAYVVLKAGEGKPDARSIRGWLSERLPTYMLPARISEVDEIGVNSHGKPDIDALRVWWNHRSQQEPSWNLCGSSVGIKFLELVSRVLKVLHPNPNATFYENGGGSLNAIYLVGLCERELDRKLEISQLLGPLTLADCVDELERYVRNDLNPDDISAPQTATTPRGNCGEPTPISSQQSGLFFLSKIKTKKSSYDINYHLDFRFRIDYRVLSRAFHLLLERHEVLRTGFIEIENKVFQSVKGIEEFLLDETDITALTEDLRSIKNEELVRDFFLQQFDLTKGLVIRAALIRPAPERSILLIKIHHIAFDGWSARIFARDLSRLYTAIADCGDTELESIQWSYRDYARWQHFEYTLNRREIDLAHWRTYLKDAPTQLGLMLDRSRPVGGAEAGRTVSTPLPIVAYDALRALSSEARASPFLVFAAAISILIQRVSGDKDFCLGFPVAGRNRIEVRDTIGLFTNVLPLRCQFDEFSTLLSTLKETQRLVLRAVDHAQLPFDQIVEELNPARSIASHPLFQICVAHEYSDTSPWELGGIRAVEVEIHARTSKYDISFTLFESAGSFEISAEYASELFKKSTICAYLREAVEILAAMKSSSDEPVIRNIDAERRAMSEIRASEFS